jgi:chemotaxis-related protein WspB
MRAVVFHVGPERFAVDTSSVTEVIPGIPARPVPAAHDALIGVIDYRGRVVPVVDLCRLFGRGACPARLSNRILVCNLAGGGRQWGEDDDRERYLGVLAEDVTRITTLDPDAPGSHPGPDTPGVRGLGRILHDGEGLIQLVRVGELIPHDVLAAMIGEAGEVDA